VTEADLDAFLAHESDPAARWMAAFASPRSPEPEPFRTRWRDRLKDPQIIARTIEVDGAPAGYVARFPMFGKPSVAYWIGRAFWGRGVATAALSSFLRHERRRTLYARVAADNLASRRVLEKCGFAVIGRETARAEARDAEVEELILRRPPARSRRPVPARRLRKPRPARPRRSGSAAA
jgi:RimJ/RimL family protein N-acetyltransferase